MATLEVYLKPRNLVQNFRTYITRDGDLVELVRENTTIDRAIRDLLQHWHEESGPQTFVIQDGNGFTVAVLMRQAKEETAFVVESDGGYGMYRVKYLLDAQGKYKSTSIEEVLV